MSHRIGMATSSHQRRYVLICLGLFTHTYRVLGFDESLFLYYFKYYFETFCEKIVCFNDLEKYFNSLDDELKRKTVKEIDKILISRDNQMVSFCMNSEEI
jgi:hypothetical protein